MLCSWNVLDLRLIFNLKLTIQGSVFFSMLALSFYNFENHEACLSWITAGYAILSIPFTMATPDGIACYDWPNDNRNTSLTMSEFCSNYTETKCENIIYEYQDKGSELQSVDLFSTELVNRSSSG